jgi:uncharacterized protein (DUF427 family)
MKAIWNGTVVAESDDTLIVDGEHYFPGASLKREFVLSSNTKRMSSAYGQATYYTLFVDGDAYPDAVWSYLDPGAEAAAMKGRVAFWKGIQVVA